MKSRRVFVTLELETDRKLTALRASGFWDAALYVMVGEYRCLQA